MKALTREELDVELCGNPACDHTEHDQTILYIHSVCHLEAGTLVAYNKKTGELEIECAACGQPVVNIAVRED